MHLCLVVWRKGDRPGLSERGGKVTPECQEEKKGGRCKRQRPPEPAPCFVINGDPAEKLPGDLVTAATENSREVGKPVIRPWL